MKCAVCDRNATHQCAACRRAVYCSAECQTEHWARGGHAAACRPAAVAIGVAPAASGARGHPTKYTLDGALQAPLRVCRGHTYTLDAESVFPAHPLYATQSDEGGFGYDYGARTPIDELLTPDILERVPGTENTFRLRVTDAVAALLLKHRVYYQCANHARMGARIVLDSAEEGAVAAAAAALRTSGYVSPVFLAESPHDAAAVYVADQVGHVYRVPLDGGGGGGGGGRGDLYLDITRYTRSLQLEPAYDERGLLSVAFDPRSAAHFYIYYTVRDAGRTYNCLSRVYDRRSAQVYREKVLLRTEQPHPYHNGGAMQWRAGAEDGGLYLTLGDGGPQGDPQRNAQNPRTRLGKLLRFTDVDSGAYEVYATGLRNAWGLSFSADGARGWVTDAGWEDREGVRRVEEVNAVCRGANYGWPHYEGTQRVHAGLSTATMPVWSYGGSDGQAVVGVVDDGTNRFYLADFAGTVWHVDPRQRRVPRVVWRAPAGTWIKALARAHGRVYALVSEHRGPRGATGRLVSVEA